MSEENAEQGPQCTATITMPDGPLRCALIAGHGKVTPFGGAVEMMSTADHTAPHSGHPFWWRDTADGATPADSTESADCPARSPHGDMCTLTRGHEGMHERHFAGERLASWETPACESRPEPHGWATRDTRCIGTAGHDGPHGDGNGLEWTVGTTEHDASRWMDTLFDGAPTVPRLKLTALNPQPVRARFIDLPPRHEERAVLSGLTATVAVPGGFALVVDRLGSQSAVSEQRPRWDDFGATIGAHVVVCYPHELDITSWYDAS